MVGFTTSLDSVASVGNVVPLASVKLLVIVFVDSDVVVRENSEELEAEDAWGSGVGGFVKVAQVLSTAFRTESRYPASHELSVQDSE